MVICLVLKPAVIRTARVAYEALAWGLLGLATWLIALPVLEMILDLPSIEGLRARSILLGLIALMAGLSRVGRPPGRGVAALAPLLLLTVVGADYLLAAMGCDFPAGFHPINAVGLMAVSLGIVRASDTLGEEEKA